MLPRMRGCAEARVYGRPWFWIGSLIVLAMGFGVACADTIPSYEQRPNVVTTRVCSDSQSGTGWNQELLDRSFRLTLASRSLYAMVGRADPARLFPVLANDQIEVRRAAIGSLIQRFREAKTLYDECLASAAQSSEGLTDNHLAALDATVAHIDATTVKLREHGRIDRVAPLYLDRIDDALIEILRVIQSPSGKESQYLGHIASLALVEWSRVSDIVCIELQCSLYGVVAPLALPKRHTLMGLAAELAAVEPSFRSWSNILKVPPEEVTVIRDILLLPTVVFTNWVEELVVLADGGGESERVSFVSSGNPHLPFSAVAIAERLLNLYQDAAVTD